MSEMETEDAPGLLKQLKRLSEEISNAYKEYMDSWESIKDSHGVYQITRNNLRVISTKRKALDYAINEFEENARHLRQFTNPKKT
jgi:GTP-sensing pleiotropic transcriptional regulator CodY